MDERTNSGLFLFAALSQTKENDSFRMYGSFGCYKKIHVFRLLILVVEVNVTIFV